MSTEYGPSSHVTLILLILLSHKEKVNKLTKGIYRTINYKAKAFSISFTVNFIS